MGKTLTNPLRRAAQSELLDSLDHSLMDDVELAVNLADIARLNRLTGTVGWISQAVFGLIPSGVQAMTLLDVGVGSADIPLALRRLAKRRGIDMHIVAADRHPGVLRSMRRSIATVRADAVGLPVPD